MMFVEKWTKMTEMIARLTADNESYSRCEDEKNELLRLLERELSESQFLKLIELVECCEVQKMIVAYELGFRDETEAG